MTVHRHGNKNKQSTFDLMEKKKKKKKKTVEKWEKRKTEQTFLATFQRRRIGENNSILNPGNSTAREYQTAIVSMVEVENRKSASIYKLDLKMTFVKIKDDPKV